MADREIKLDLLATDKTGPATRKAADNLDDVADAADRASKNNETLSDSADDAAKSSDGLGKSTEETSHKTDGLGKSSSTTADHVAKLTHEIGLAENELKSLHESFARTDDAAERIDLSRTIRRTEQDLKRLNKSKGVLAALLPSPAEVAQEAGKVGKQVGKEVTESTATAMESLSKAVTPVLVGVGIAAAPLLGATISAAIIGGAGVGGVLGGVLLASKDPRVQAAGAQLGSNLLNRLEIRASVFVNPVLQGIKQIQDGFDGSADDIGRIFQNASKFVQPLTAGVVGFLQHVTHGLADLTDSAGPVIDVISNGLDGLGRSIEGVFEDLKDNGVDAAVALDSVFKTLELTISTVGVAINALTETYGFLVQVGAFGQDAAQEYARLSANAKIAAASNGEVAGSLGDVKGVGTAVTGTISRLSDAVGDLTAGNRSLYGSTVDAAEAIARTTQTIDDNGKGLSLNTEKGRENRAALSSLADALSRNYDNYVKVNGAGAGAEKVAENNRKAFVKLATEAGYSAGAASDLADELLGIPNVNRTLTVRVRVFGAAAANAALQTARILSGYRAGGGDVKAGHAYVVGEHRAEVFVPKEDGTIVSSVDKYNAQSTAGGGSAGGGSRLDVLVRPAPNLSRDLAGAIVEALQYECRTSYGKSAQRMFGG